MTSAIGIDFSDLLNTVALDGVVEAIARFNLPASAVEPLTAWLQAEDHVLELEEQVRRAEQISDAIASQQLQPLFDAAVRVA